MLSLFSPKVKKYPLKEDKVYVGAGINLLNQDEIGRIYWDRPHYQAIVFGGSGSGKSELIARWTYEAILDDKQVFLIDPKGSKSWLEAFFLACHRKGILYDKEKGPVVLTLPYPEISAKINVLHRMNPHQIAYTLSSGIPEGKEPFFKQIAYEIVLVSALGLKAKGVDEIILSDIYRYLKVENLQQLHEAILSDIKFVSEERAEYARQALMTLEKIATFDPQYFPRVNSSLRTYLTRLITGNAGKILNVRAGNILWDRLEKGNLKFFAFLNAEAMQQIAYDVGRLLFANLLTYVGHQSQKLEKIEPQLRTIVDEATEVGFSELNKAIRLVRERNVSVSIFTQSPSGFASAFGKDGKGMVIDIVNSCDLRIGFRLASSEDRKFMAEMSPEVSKGQLMLHQNSMNLYYKEAKLLKPFDFESLDPGFGYAFLDKTVYYFYTPRVKKYDKTKVEVVFTDEPEKVKADVVVNLKEISKSYPDAKPEEIDINEFNIIVSKPKTQQTQQQKQEEDVLVVLMKKIQENYKVDIPLEIEDIELKRFYEEIKDFFKFFEADLKKILKFFDVIKTSVPSVIGNDKNMLARIDLLNHSLNVAYKAYEEVKDIQGLTQEEKEKIVLASLAHDIGKAVAYGNKKAYEGKDHERLTKQVLKQLKVHEDIVKLASSHHDKPEELGHLGKLLEYVKMSDHSAREEETEKANITVASEIREKLNLNKLLKNLIEQAFINKDVFTNLSGNNLYVSKDYIYRLIEKTVKQNNVDFAINDEFVESLFVGSKFVKSKGYDKKGGLLFNGIFLQIPLNEPISVPKNKWNSVFKGLFDIKIEEI